MQDITHGFLRLEKGKVEGWKEFQDFTLSTDVTVIGRPSTSEKSGADTMDINIRNDFVSRSHLRIYFDYDTGCFIAKERDNGTQNGTFISGERMKPGIPYTLRDGDSIGIAKVGGDYQVVFRFRESESTLVGAIEAGKPHENDFRIDLTARRIWVNDKEVLLRKKEFDLLAFLYQNRGKACSRDEIAKNVWAEEGGIITEETIDTNIHRIRALIEPEPDKPHYIITLPRYGFRLEL